MQSVQKQMHHQFRVPLKGNALVEESAVVFKHALAKVLDLGENLCQSDPASLQLPSVCPDYAHHLVDLKADQGKQSRSPSLGWSRPICRVYELVFFTVVRKPGIIVFSPDGRLRALGFAGSDIQEAKLVPDQTPHMCLQRVEVICFAAVPV